MATFTAAKLGLSPITASQAGQIVHDYGTVEVTTALAADDIVKLCNLPAEHELVDFMLLADDLDTYGTPTITISVGVLNADGDDLVASTNVLTNSTVAQAGGVARANLLAGLTLASSASDRIIAAKITTVGATPAAGTLRGHIQYCRKS
jgi:hypothetical protein